jgi:hypothetical protein
MDPVTGIGLAASAAQLLELSVQVLIKIRTYYISVRDAHVQVAKLRSELDSLVNVLSSVQDLFERKPNDRLYPALTNELVALRALLNDLYARLEPKRTAGIGRFVRWPFQQTENDRIISNLQIHKASLSLSLNVDQTCIPGQSFAYS